MSFTQKPSPEFIDLLKKAGSADKAEALVAQHELAKAIELPLRRKTNSLPTLILVMVVFQSEQLKAIM
jgi:hypothetical protein